VNIPESAIRPFEPHGIPNLKYGTSCDALLEKEFLHLNLLGEDEDYCMALDDLEEYLISQLKNAGAIEVSVMVDHTTQVLCIVSIFYTVPGIARVQRCIKVVHARGGFMRTIK
jgi:hypothetical protein